MNGNTSFIEIIVNMDIQVVQHWVDTETIDTSEISGGVMYYSVHDVALVYSTVNVVVDITPEELTALHLAGITGITEYEHDESETTRG